MIKIAYSVLLVLLLWVSYGLQTASAQARKTAKSPTSANVNQAPLLTPAELARERWYINLEDARKNPDKVYKLDLSDNKLREFPIEVLMFKNLQVLNLSDNHIKSIPPEIKIFKNLQELNLYHNRIKFLPAEIGDLANLHTLLLANNNLYKFPIEIRGLQKLQLMDITSNNVTFHEMDYVRKYIPNCTLKY